MAANTYLSRVTESRQKLKQAKREIEERVRNEVARELGYLAAQADIAIGTAYANGASIADLKRAYGTKDYRTIRDAIERADAAGILHGKFRMEGPGTLVVSDEGEEERFDIFQLEGNEHLFVLVPNPLRSVEDRSPIAEALDNRFDGELYEEANKWVQEHS